MFIVHRKDLKRDGTARAILDGLRRLPRVVHARLHARRSSRGSSAAAIYAVPNLRGGGEYGEEWHEAGMLQKKQNVFDDFIGRGRVPRARRSGRRRTGSSCAAARTAASSSARRSRSARSSSGVALCGVPLLDMVRYHLFGSGKTWVPEYGSAEEPAQFKALYAYSPYHHVKAGHAATRPSSSSRPTATTASTRCTRASSPGALQARHDGRARPPAHREARRARRRRPREVDRRDARGRIRVRALGDSGERRGSVGEALR